MGISGEMMFFGIFSIVIISILLIDLLVVGKGSHIVSTREAGSWTFVWVSMAVAFYFVIYYFGDRMHGITSYETLLEVKQKYAPHLNLTLTDFQNDLITYRTNMATEYITGYLMEYTLSIDNVFVIMMILSAFAVTHENYKTVLFWGVLGAVVLRFIFIFAGAALIQKFIWTLYIFGAFLVFSGVKMFLERNKKEKIEVSSHWLVRLMGRFLKVYPEYEKGKFFIMKDKTFYITPLFIVLMFIEFTDLVFAFDSIPAIFSITRDPYIVFFSNIFAIIGLRSLFFLLIKIIDLFHYLKIGVSVLLVFIGIKLLAHNILHTIGYKSIYSLYFILFVLIGSIVFSILFPKKEKV